MGNNGKLAFMVTTDIEKPGTWVRYRKSLCESCYAGCCTLIVEVSSDDLVRMGITDGWEVENCLKELVKRLKKEKIIQRYNSKTGRFVLTQKKGGDCLFLDKNRQCRVYEDRPEVCRNHPEVRGPRVGYCPYLPV